MYRPYIEKNGKGLVIKDHINGSMLIEILKHEYLDLRDEIYSDWILHLCSKTWITMPLLYELAEIFRKEYPQNNINWEETLQTAKCILE